jgi:peroxiredoxin
MKHFILIAILASICSFNAISQVPTKAEDICPLLIGEDLPNGRLKDAYENPVDLHDLINEKASVVVFYRGGWCPYCNAHLSELATLEDQIIKLGFQLIAISTEEPQNLLTTTDKNKTGFTLLSDPKGIFMQEVGIGFEANEKTQAFMAKNVTGEFTTILPVPTLMVVSAKAEILFEYISPNYKQRITDDILMAVLKSID